MFKNKYKVSLLDSKWVALKRGINLGILPKKDEIVFFGNKYYVVLNIVHDLRNTQEILIIADELGGDAIPKEPKPQTLND